ncbi:MAG: 5'-nucleotidase C-terminal domain-containing protein [Bacteroidales bacterium]|nr:5'-nucleotidase C-terminal domain-containing protein [Bacteroidales bacterium]
MLKMILNTFILSFSISLISASPESPGKKLIILHTNDLHSRLDGFAPSGEYTPLSVNDDNTIGGFSRIATILKNEKSKNPSATLIVDAGDFLMGTIYHYMEEYNGFQLPLMNDMGYDFAAIGNHEFDYGPGKLALIIEKSVTGDKIPGLLLTNAVFDDEDDRDNRLEELFERGVITRTSIIEKSGIRIGLFSLMGADADDVAPFAPPVTFARQKKSAKKAVKQLKKEGCDVIICLSHSGVEKNKKGEWSGEDVKLAKKVKGLDLIISGHSHTVLNEPVIVKGIPIVQTGANGCNVGKLELIVASDGLTVESYTLIPVNDNVTGDKDIQARIDDQKRKISSGLFEPLGYDVESDLIRSGFELVCDEHGGDLESSNLGPLVVDAMHSYINTYSTVGTDISMVAAGVIRDRVPIGMLLVQDIFRIMSLGSGKDSIPGYPLARVYVTGIELKRIVEILLVAYKSSPSNFCYYAGIEVDFDPEKGLLRKIISISLVDSDGVLTPVDLNKKSDKLYSVSANAYMLEFIGIIKKTTFGLVNVTPKNANGLSIADMEKSVIDFDKNLAGVQEGKEWIALVEYLKVMKDTDGDDVADMDQFYLNPPLRIRPADISD